MEVDSEYTHNFHPYPAKFPAHAVRTLIKKYSKPSDTILDPFCGSGTTLVECRLLNRNGIGIELNPVGKLISEAKSAYYKNCDIELILGAVENLQRHSFTTKKWMSQFSLTDILPNHPNKEYWFKPHVLKELFGIKKIIDQYSKNTKVQNLLMTGFSRIIVPVSNQESETRYKAIEKDIPLGYTLRLYIKVINEYVNVLRQFNLKNTMNKVQIEIIEGDANEKISQLRKIDFVVTSPPYINSYDYYLYHKHRIFWLDKNPRKVRKLEVGGHHTVDRQSYDEALKDYQHYLLTIFQKISTVLKQKKFFAILIGDGVVKGKKINADEVIREIAEKSNFSIVSSNSIPLKSVSRQFIKGTHNHKKLHHEIILQNNAK